METTKKTVGDIAEKTDLLLLKGESRYNGGVWSDIPLSDSASLSYGNLDRYTAGHEKDDEHTALVYVPELLSGSDYSGGSVTIANFRAFKEQFKDSQGADWWELYGGHGTYAVAIRAACENEAIIEFFEGLENYPCANDELMSEVEREAEDESWESWIRSDFERALKAQFPESEELIDGADESKLRELLAGAMDRANEYFEHETGGGVYLRLENILKHIDAEHLETLKAEVQS